MNRAPEYHLLGRISLWLFLIYAAALGCIGIYAWLRTGGDLTVLLDFLVFLTLMTGIALSANLIGFGTAIAGILRARKRDDKPVLAQIAIVLHGLAMIASLLGTLYLIQQ